MKIHGTLTLTSPLMIAEPNAGDVRVDLAGRYVKNGGFPTTRVVHLRIPAVGEHEGMNVPVIAANSLRGGLRRAGAELIEEALISRGETLTLGAYHSLRCGTPYGHPDKSTASLSEIRRAQEVPPLAVFGGGPRMIESALRVDTGLPILHGLIDRGLLPENLRENAVAVKDGQNHRLTTFLFLRRADDAATFVDHKLAEHVVTDYAQGIDAWQVLVGKAGRDPDANEGSTPKGNEEGPMRALAALNPFQCVVPGTPFSFGMDITTEHQASVGFAILALARFANKQTLGGYKRLGFGRFALSVEAVHDTNTMPVLVREAGQYSADTRDPDVAKAVDAAQAWLDKIKAADLNDLLLPKETSREAVRKKLKGNKEAEAAFDAVYGK